MWVIATGVTEPIYVYATDNTQAPLTGLTDLKLRIRRDSDGFFLDWADDTFKSAGWSTRDVVLSEINATLDPGNYQVPGGWDTSAITNIVADDVYTLISLQDPGTDAELPGPSQLKIGHESDQTAETWYVHGLDPSNPLVVDSSTPAGSRKVPLAGTIIDQTVATVGNVTTVTKV
jgi:hypothetical protein